MATKAARHSSFIFLIAFPLVIGAGTTFSQKFRIPGMWHVGFVARAWCHAQTYYLEWDLAAN